LKKLLILSLLLMLTLVGACHPKAGSNGPTGKPDPPFLGEAPEDAYVNQSSGNYGGTLVLATNQNPTSFNPITQAGATTNWVLLNVMYEAMVGFDRELQVETASLAQSWESTPDALTWTFHLRRGVKWSDGEPFTADDVVFTFETIADPNSASTYRVELAQTDGTVPTVEKLDDYTVRFQLKEVNAIFLDVVLDGFLVPKHKWGKAFESGSFRQAMALNSDPKDIVGLGPYRLVSFTPDQRMVLERNPYYWRVDKDGKRLPYLDRVIFTILPNTNAWALKMQNREIDMMHQIQPNLVDQVMRDQNKGDYKVYDLGPDLVVSYVAFNRDTESNANGKPYVDPVKLKWFRETKFRQAVSYAIDREAMVRTAFNGRAIPVWGFDTPTNKRWYNEAVVTKRPVDPEKARELLKEIGITDTKGDGIARDSSGHPIEFTLNCSSTNIIRVNMATVIKDSLAKVGINVNLQPIDNNLIINKIQETHDFEAVIGIWQSGVPVDPVEDKVSLLPTGDLYPSFSHQKDPSTEWERQLTDLIQRSSTTTDLPTRQKYYWEAMRIWSEELPEIDLIAQDVFVAAKNNIGNLKPSPLENFSYWNLYELYFTR
jgi:peptide/nickel transport system substrate-binding protein